MRQRVVRFGFCVTLFGMLGLVVASCTPDPVEKLFTQTTDGLNGCDVGAKCTYPSFCFYDQSSKTGKLDCQMDGTFGTSCLAGNYCDASHLGEGCVDPTNEKLSCNLQAHLLVVSQGGTGGQAGAGGGQAGAGGSGGTGGSGGAGGQAGAGGAGGAGGAAGAGGQAGGDSCPETGIMVPCNVGQYGCLPVNVAFCLDGADAGVQTILQCLCPNPNDGMKGTWEKSGSKCPDLKLCWDQNQSGSGGAGGSGGGSGGQAGAGGAAVDAGADAVVPDELMAAWTPKQGYTQSGKVFAEGWYVDAQNVNHDWGQLCDLTLSNGVFSCSLGVPSDYKYLEVHLKHADANAPGGVCGVFDKSKNVPCGGDGAIFGTVVFTKGGNTVPYTLKWNGSGPPPPDEVFFNAVVSPLT